MEFYQRLKDCREDNDMKQEEIAKLLGTTQRQYSRWETGSYKIPIDKFIELAVFYNVSLDYLAGLIPHSRPLYINRKGEK